MIYLASPYTDILPEVMQKRYLAAQEAAAYLLRQRLWCYSPIVHCHELAISHNLPKDFGFWSEYNFHMLARANKLVVLEIPGWEYSTGVGAEISYWKVTKGQPWFLATPSDCKVGKLDTIL